jgi:hypothetical protein
MLKNSQYSTDQIAIPLLCLGIARYSCGSLPWRIAHAGSYPDPVWSKASAKRLANREAQDCLCYLVFFRQVLLRIALLALTCEMMRDIARSSRLNDQTRSEANAIRMGKGEVHARLLGIKLQRQGVFIGSEAFELHDAALPKPSKGKAVQGRASRNLKKKEGESSGPGFPLPGEALEAIAALGKRARHIC